MSFNFQSMSDWNDNAQLQYKQAMDAFNQDLSTLSQSKQEVQGQYGQQLQGIQNWGQGQQYGAQQVYNQNLANIQQGDVSRGLTNSSTMGNQDYQAAGGYQQALLGVNQASMAAKLGVQQNLAQYTAGIGQAEAGVYGQAANYMGQVGQQAAGIYGQQQLAQQQFGYNAALANIQATNQRTAQAQQNQAQLQQAMISAPPVTQSAPYGFQVGQTPSAGGYGTPATGGSAFSGSPGYSSPATDYSGGGGDYGGGDYGYGGGEG
jgi:hypothetical protein